MITRERYGPGYGIDAAKNNTPNDTGINQATGYCPYGVATVLENGAGRAAQVGAHLAGSLLSGLRLAGA